MKKKLSYDPRRKPPNTSRYCIICDRVTSWKYNRTIGHSQCSECGSTSLYAAQDKKNAEYLKKSDKVVGRF